MSDNLPYEARESLNVQTIINPQAFVQQKRSSSAKNSSLQKQSVTVQPERVSSNSQMHQHRAPASNQVGQSGYGTLGFNTT